MCAHCGYPAVSAACCLQAHNSLYSLLEIPNGIDSTLGYLATSALSKATCKGKSELLLRKWAEVVEVEDDEVPRWVAVGILVVAIAFGLVGLGTYVLGVQGAAVDEAADVEVGG